MTKPSAPRPRKPRDHVYAYTEREYGAVDGDPLIFLNVDDAYPKRYAVLRAKEARAFAAWLLRAADWLDATQPRTSRRKGSK